jgi:mono/diheme cytochrome c family protein
MKVQAAIFLFLSIMAFAAAVSAAQTGRDIFYDKCLSCHSGALALNKTKSEKQWEVTIDRMTGHGLEITSAQAKAVAKFLASGGK